MNARAGWFEVNRAGLARVAGRRTKIFILRELLQNSWDEASQIVTVEVRAPAKPNGLSIIRVTDDSPEGFADLSHAYTLFAPSAKVADAAKRGRFNFGEKLVLALCSEARIETTKGTVLFDRGETRRRSPKKRAAGSMFEGFIKLTAEERESLIRSARQMIPPNGKMTIVNGEEVFPRAAVVSFEHCLTTEVAGDDGMLRSQYRTCMLRVYDVLPGEKASLYEMGIPVVETGDRWHVDIGQKIPLNMERDNVAPSYLQDVRVSVANATRDLLTVEDANAPWARNALEDYQCQPETIKRLVELRFGDKAVVHDPNDQEANHKAAAEGYTVVTGSQFGSQEWERIRSAEALTPAGRLFPTAKAFHDDGRPLKLIAAADQSDGVRAFVILARLLGKEILGWDLITVEVADEPSWKFEAVIQPNKKLLIVNAGLLGEDWFTDQLSAPQFDLLIHEFAHVKEANHLSERYYNELSRLGGAIAELVLRKPRLFQ